MSGIYRIYKPFMIMSQYTTRKNAASSGRNRSFSVMRSVPDLQKYSEFQAISLFPGEYHDIFNKVKLEI